MDVNEQDRLFNFTLRKELNKVIALMKLSLFYMYISQSCFLFLFAHILRALQISPTFNFLCCVCLHHLANAAGVSEWSCPSVFSNVNYLQYMIYYNIMNIWCLVA